MAGALIRPNGKAALRTTTRYWPASFVRTFAMVNVAVVEWTVLLARIAAPRLHSYPNGVGLPATVTLKVTSWPTVTV